MRRTVAATLIGASCAALISGAASPSFAQPQVAVLEPVEGAHVERSLLEKIPSNRALALRDALAAIQPASEVEKADLEEVRAFYEARAFEPIWTGSDSSDEKALALIARLGTAARDGLDAANYGVPKLDMWAPADEAAAHEVRLSLSAVAYARHLASGRFHPSDVAPEIKLEPQRPNAGETLQALAQSASIAETMDGFAPTHASYARLRAALHRLMDAEAKPKPLVPEGAVLRLGERSERVVVLRWRLNVAAAEGADPALYDEAVRDAVIGFQRARGLMVDGLAGRSTIAALNRDTKKEDIAAIVTNMERWRWMPRDLGRFHVRVNVPEYRVRVMKDGVSIHETRVVVGKPEHQTPIFSDEMEHVVVNPYWNVPVSILMEEMLPSIKRNPRTYLGRRGYQVLASLGGRMRVVDPYTVNWWDLDTSRVRVRQTPSQSNALGRIKFLFPNQDAIYLHDTPSKHLFKRSARAYSHGCVRVQDPFAFADALLEGQPNTSGEAVRGLLGPKERWVNIENTIPVHLSYFTLRAEEDGSLSRFADIYGHDTRLKAKLGL